jgi:hypothetical protein
MSLRHSLDWSTAIRDTRASAAADRPTTSAVVERTIREMGAKAALKAASSLTLVVDGTFNRSAIMKQAIAEAHLERARGSALPWSTLLSSALKFAWLRAKMARKAQVR